MNEEECQYEAFLRLYISPHRGHCMSSCKNEKISALVNYYISFETRANTYKVFFFTFFLATVVLGFSIIILYFRFITFLLRTLFFCFSFLFFIYDRPKCKRILSFWVVWISFGIFKASCSFCMCLFSISSSKISCFKIFMVVCSCGLLVWSSFSCTVEPDVFSSTFFSIDSIELYISCCIGFISCVPRLGIWMGEKTVGEGVLYFPVSSYTIHFRDGSFSAWLSLTFLLTFDGGVFFIWIISFLFWPPLFPWMCFLLLCWLYFF